MADESTRERSASTLEAFARRHEKKPLLRFLTCGSVDDGKSTLIGRLLYDTRAIYDDQLSAVRKDSVIRGTTGTNFDPALLTDGLKAEREQGITIDVAYRYFSTDRRKFIIADTPGHEQYTRNMATGASNCDVAVILIDARHGVQVQTRRHAFIVSLLGIRHVIVAVNKMDLVGWSEERFEAIREDVVKFSAKLSVDDQRFIPMSALHGDNVAFSSSNTPWYEGGSLIHHLESVTIEADRNLIDLRFPVQRVTRPHRDYRGFAGTVASGVLRVGDEIVAVPSGRRSRVASIDTFDGSRPEASAGHAVTVVLQDEIDLSRGDMIVRPGNTPRVARELDAMIVWMSEQPMEIGREYLIKHTTRTAPAQFVGVRYAIDMTTLHQAPAAQLGLNDVGRCELQMSRPLLVDAYQSNRTTGAFIVIDRLSNATVAAGMVLDRRVVDAAVVEPKGTLRSANTTWHAGEVSIEENEARMGQRGAILWFTGLSGAGKSTVARLLERRLFDAGRSVFVLDGDNVRHGLCGDLGFSMADRAENIRRVAHVAELLRQAGMIVIVAFISPYSVDRQRARELAPRGRFLEIYLESDVETCAQRDPKGLYVKALAGEIKDFTGVSAPYEAPEAPELLLDTRLCAAADSVEKVVQLLRAHGIIDVDVDLFGPR